MNTTTNDSRNHRTLILASNEILDLAYFPYDPADVESLIIDLIEARGFPARISAILEDLAAFTRQEVIEAIARLRRAGNLRRCNVIAEAMRKQAA